MRQETPGRSRRASIGSCWARPLMTCRWPPKSLFRRRLGALPTFATSAARQLVSAMAETWRRRRDSNPRYGNSPYGGLANRWFQPLTHVSGSGSGAAAYIGAIYRLQPERTTRAWVTANVRP